jgi:hypothetical protein
LLFEVLSEPATHALKTQICGEHSERGQKSGKHNKPGTKTVTPCIPRSGPMIHCVLSY